MIGVFTSVSPLTLTINNELLLQEIISNITKDQKKNYRHQRFSMGHIMRELPSMNSSKAPYDILFNYLKFDYSELKFSENEATLFYLSHNHQQTPLSIIVWEGDNNEVALHLDYNLAYFSKEEMILLGNRLEYLLESLRSNITEPLRNINLLPEKERQTLMIEWNGAKKQYDNDNTIHNLFEIQAAQTPDAIALVCNNQQLTFSELNIKANQLAHYLIQQGVGPEVLVGLYVNRSLEMMIGILGILKAGGAYVPIDPNYPSERIGFMVNNSKPSILLSQYHLKPIIDLGKFDVKTFFLDSDWNKIKQLSELNPKQITASNHLAYVIYTSGSTGKPKGVCVSHQAAINLKTTLLNRIYKDIGEVVGLRIGLNASISFDASIQQWLLLLQGASLYLIPEQTRKDPNILASTLSNWGLDVMDCTPSQLPFLLSSKYADGLPRHILVGGEAINLQLWKKLQQQSKISFYNVYGLTETTVDSVYCDIQKSDAYPVLGLPLDNVEIYILDEWLNPVPIGVVGEIYIGGAGLARGYFDQPQTTAEKFIPSPFSVKPGARMFKSGDIARYLPDGNIEYLGRNDNQVKIRGFRIELGEIEAGYIYDPK